MPIMSAVGERKEQRGEQDPRVSIEHIPRGSLCLQAKRLGKSPVGYLSQDERILQHAHSYFIRNLEYYYFRIITVSQPRVQALGPEIVKGEIVLFTTDL